MTIKQTAMVLAACLALAGAGEGMSAGRVTLLEWQMPSAVQKQPFELGHGKGELRTWGHRRGAYYREFFAEFLPALFERTLVLDKLDLKDGRLDWLFTGELGGFTIEIGRNEVSLYQRYYDSFALEKISGTDTARHRHPEWRSEVKNVVYSGSLRAVTVKLDHKLALEVALNGESVFRDEFLLDVSRHQLNMTGRDGQVSGKMLSPRPESATVRVEPTSRHQTIVGFGGIATPTAYAQLSVEGKRRWWQLLCEYNLLIQREYPIGTRLNENMDNWDRLEDAMPHYYGNNFPNGEICDFNYLKILRQLGGKVWFEFWRLPPWVGRDVAKYTKAMVNYCQVLRERTGMPPDVVGIQNEKKQTEEMWHKMTLALRRELDKAGFESVKIHMSDDGRLKSGIERAKAFRSSKEVWDNIDYSAVHMYDYQDFFTNPDGFDGLLIKWKQLTGDKPFLSTELCINSDRYQLSSYRIALAMGQLYHKNLVLTDAAAVCYCWTLLNVVQPSYGYTRSLFVPDRSHGFVPSPSSFQLRVFGAYSRRIREGMVRAGAKAETDDLLVSAFASEADSGTLVVLNRSTKPRQVRVVWPGMQLKYMETVDPYHQNTVQPAPEPGVDGTVQVMVEPGAVITLTSAALGRVPDSVIQSIK